MKSITKESVEALKSEQCPCKFTSLSKLIGKKVVDVSGYISQEFGEDTPVFQIAYMIFEDGSYMSTEGEHDLPYICCDNKIEGLDEETLNKIYEIENEE